MLKIRKAQMEAFSRAVARDYEDRMVLHLGEYFPDESRALGEEGTRAMIRLGVQRAAAHEVDDEGDVCLYLNLMLALGKDFDADPELPELRAMLESSEEDGPTRLGRAYDWAMSRQEGLRRDGEDEDQDDDAGEA